MRVQECWRVCLRTEQPSSQLMANFIGPLTTRHCRLQRMYPANEHYNWETSTANTECAYIQLQSRYKRESRESCAAKLSALITLFMSTCYLHLLLFNTQRALFFLMTFHSFYSSCTAFFFFTNPTIFAKRPKHTFLKQSLFETQLSDQQSHQPFVTFFNSLSKSSH